MVKRRKSRILDLMYFLRRFFSRKIKEWSLLSKIWDTSILQVHTCVPLMHFYSEMMHLNKLTDMTFYFEKIIKNNVPSIYLSHLHHILDIIKIITDIEIAIATLRHNMLESIYVSYPGNQLMLNVYVCITKCQFNMPMKWIARQAINCYYQVLMLMNYLSFEMLTCDHNTSNLWNYAELVLWDISVTISSDVFSDKICFIYRFTGIRQ